ncbi:hypothetical protein [Micromonospora parva]|uniref:hypothetical protein n=1 Tax=Micromonospora parva TaxID=1464048 RepID=UPI0033D55ABC
MSSSPVPKAIRDDVVRELYRRVEALDWELLTVQQKNRYYARWVEDQAIGGRLTEFQTAEDARVWIKDGAMKEYARALDGAGPFRHLVTVRLSGLDELIRRALGEDWTMLPRSRGDKPSHCVVTNGDIDRYMCWGKPGTFRDLIWAALNKVIEHPHPPMIVVTLRDGQHVNGEDRRRHERLAAHCGVDVRHIHRRLVFHGEV